MEKLGLANSTLVKTTTHVHPVMNNLPMGAGPHGDLKKKSTTSPASTLSDKGIGSSVGSFDSEYRHETSISYTTKLTHDPNRTGSLDSRTQEVSEKSIPIHTRSSSDIVCQSRTANVIHRPMLAEQSNAPLWNGDPRRLSAIGTDATLTSSIRPKKIKSKSKAEFRQIEKDSDVRKLPQLCQEASTHSSSTCSQSSTPAMSSVDIGPGGDYSKMPVTADFTPVPMSLPPNHKYTSSYDEMAPPLPPKAAHLRSSENSTNVSSADPHQLAPYSAYPESSHSVPTPGYVNPSSIHSVGAMATPMRQPRHPAHLGPNTFPNEAPLTCALGLRRKVSLPLERTQLSSAGMGTGFVKAESFGGLHLCVDRKRGAKCHRSFDDNEHLFNSSYAGSDHSSAHSDDMFKRQAKERSSTRSNPGDRRRPNHSEQARIPSSALRAPDFAFQPFSFELPHSITSETKFVGREWLFNEISAIFASRDPKTNKVAIITGEKARGKTAIIDQLASCSYRGRNSFKRTELDTLTRIPPGSHRSSSPLNRSFLSQYSLANSNHSSRTGSPAPSLASGGSSRAGSQASLTEDSCRKVASQVVAFHFCQSDHNVMCYLPEFLLGVAAQMSHAPQLTSYRELLNNDPNTRALLTLQNCIQNPSQVLNKAILEPLKLLRRNQKLPKSNMIILIDAINEGENYLSDYGHSIHSFLREHLPNFPDFVKVVITCRTGSRNLVAELPGKFISLDGDNPSLSRDMNLYISHRISCSAVLANLTLSVSGKADTALAHKQLSQHLIKTAGGNFLYIRMILDLIDNGSLIPKSAGFTTFPRNLHEVFLLLCNLKFHSYTSFDDVRDIMAVALASLYPIRDELLHKIVTCVLPPNTMTFPVFLEQMKILDGLLVQNPLSGKRSFFHPTFKEWLIGQLLPVKGNGTLQCSNRFKVDVKRGNFLIATFLSTLPPEPLNKQSVLEMAHHVLKASSMLKAQSPQTGLSSSDFNLHFMAAHAHCNQITAALISPRNMLYPNIKICKLLLKAGANPNCNTEIFCNAPPLAVAAHCGYFELAELLLMFNADVNLQATNGMTALAFASAAGYMEILQLLLKYRPILNNYDQNGHSPLLHAIARNHTDIAQLLLSPNFYPTPEHLELAVQQALVASATIGNLKFIDYLLANRDLRCDVNKIELFQGELPLTSAASRGNVAVCEYLIKHCGANVYLRNKEGLTPLLCAVKHGEYDAVNVLLIAGAQIEACDVSGKTPLICAAYGGHLGILEVLMSQGANLNAVDKNNMTGLLWAVYRGHCDCARSLIGQCDIRHCNVEGRTVLHLAAMSRDPQIIDTLLEAGANVYSTDESGKTALDCAIEALNLNTVIQLLSHGSPIQTISWELANGNLEIIKALLNSSLEQATDAYKLMDYDHSRDICAGALQHMGEDLTEGRIRPNHRTDIAEFCASVLLAYSKCLRKLDSLEDAYAAASRALELKPNWYEASYERARVSRDQSRLESALLDVIDAERYAPPNYKKEVRRLVDKIKEEIRTNESRNDRSSSDVNTPRVRPRLNSSSSYHGKPSHARSSSPLAANLSRSHRSGSFCPPPDPLNSDTQRMIRVNSQDSLVAPTAGISLRPNKLGPYHVGSVRRAPSTNTHWRPQVGELSRSLSTGTQMAHFNRNKTPRPYEHVNYPPYSGCMGPGVDAPRGALVTDL